ncbi:MAG TPA: membrane protein insertase YidC [Methylomirabilota bacterium]|nr:membrane protein insertase YidC [Methylomirabilota bacterium]
MDRKSILIIVISFVLMLLWGPMVNKLYPPTKAPISTNSLSSATNSVTNAAAGTNAQATLGPAQTNAGATLTTAATNALPNPGPEETLVLEDADARYVFTSRGGGVKEVQLKKHPAAVVCNDTNAASAAQASLNAGAPMPLFAVVGERDANYRLEKLGGNGVRATSQLPNGVAIVKDFRLSTNYLLQTTVRFENRTANIQQVPTHGLVIGTATPLSSHDETDKLGLQWYNGSKTETINEPYFANRTLGCFPGTPRTEFLGGASNVYWGAVYNQFFTIITVPVSGTNQAASLPAQIAAVRAPLPQPTAAQIATDSRIARNPFGFQTSFIYPGIEIPANSALAREFSVYAGPKEYQTLARLPHNVDLVMGFGGFFGWFAKILLLAMNALHNIGLSYALAIIAITIIIKLLFWPLTTASTRSMKRMSAMQPQMKAIQEKYKDDPQKMNRKMMEFMRENKINPIGGCLPILIQLPFFFGFYTMLQSAIELRGAEFLWACDLSQADTVAVIAGFPINIMPILMGATMLWQARLTPPSPGMDPMQANMMRYMPLMFVVFLYNFSAGLTLYWTVQNLLSIAQMKLTKDKPTPGTPGPAAAKPTQPRKA